MNEPLTFEVCPSCGSGKVEVGSAIIHANAPAECKACGWSGRKEELMTAATPSGELTDDLNPDAALGIAQEVSKAYMTMLAQHAGQPIGLAMVQSGVVGVQDKDSLTRLIRAACMGAHKATLEEVEAMQKEILDDGRPKN